MRFHDPSVASDTDVRRSGGPGAAGNCATVLREVRNSYLGSVFPASTLVEVRKLARDEFMLEIEAIAVSGK